MAVCLDHQIFYNPAVATGLKPASCGPRVREGGPSAAISGVPLSPPLPQSSAGESQADAILIPSDDEFDDLDGRSDTSFESLDRLLPDARNKVKSGRVAGTGKGVDATSDNSDAPEPSVTSMAGLDNESPASPIALHAEQDRPVPASPASPASHHTLVCAGLSYRQGDGCARHPNLSVSYRRLRNAKSPKAKADNEGSEGDEPEPADAGLPLHPPYSQDRIDFRRDVGGQCNTNLEADHRPTCSPVPDDRGEQNGMCPAVPPQVVESRARTPTLPHDESTGELEPADAEPRLQPQSPCSAASGRGVDPQQRSGSCRLSQHRDHRDDSVQTSDLEHYHPLVPEDGGEQDEESSIVPPQAQASRAGMPSSSGDEIGNEHELANTKLSILPSASQERANLQHDIGRCRRRRRCDTDDEEDCSPIVGSDAKQGKDEDIVRPPRGKRRRVNTSAPTTRRTAPKRQTRLCYTNSPSLQAQRPPPTQGPKRRQSQRSSSKPQSSGGSALEEEIVEAAFASFEEWPLEAVLKRVWVDGAATFQVEFTWNPCTNHRRNDRAPESPPRKSPAGRTSSTGRALPTRVASTAEEVQGDEYFEVEDIRGWRQGEEGREYLVKWKGYGHKHNTWEPAAHLEKCPEILQQFHQRKGLPTTS